MNTYEIEYTGNLRTAAKHLDSGEVIYTDAPKDNHGLGETFSPTDMVCTALASCMLTIMAIAVEKNGVDITGTKIMAEKTMGNDPRRIAQISVNIVFTKNFDTKTRNILQRSALNCPVHRSLSDDMIKNVSFTYPE
ncbi:MAG TPA: osmotically inducible protein OsmC [Flavobacteriales bacterium]|nr:osmotically inducible protein OsmC [Flavobacteriales bacterium]